MMDLSPEMWFQCELLFRIILACALGYVIGYERMSRDKSAGMRTHAIVGLGAGIIFVRNNMVSGLTTAAGIWITAGVGMAIGAGSYFIGSGAGILVVLTQILLHKISFLSSEPTRGYLKVTTNQFDDVMGEIQEKFDQEKIKVMGFKINKAKAETKIEIDLLYPARYQKNELLLAISRDSRVHGISG